MKTFTEPEFLTDKELLPELDDLRRLAWKHNPSRTNINLETDPNGFFDDADEDAVYWVSYNDKWDIVAAARLGIVEEVIDLPDPPIVSNDDVPDERPFLLFSWFVIHPEYENLISKEKFDLARLEFQVENDYPFAVTVANITRANELRNEYGWQNLGSYLKCHDAYSPIGNYEEFKILLLQEVKLPPENTKLFNLRS